MWHPRLVPTNPWYPSLSLAAVRSAEDLNVSGRRCGLGAKSVPDAGQFLSILSDKAASAGWGPSASGRVLKIAA